MFIMIFVNDIAGVPNSIVPAWMKHYHGKSGMTFVDMVFPAFLFLVGMSIPSALGSRGKKGDSWWRTVLHVLARTASLLLIGVLMVNETPDTKAMGWSGALWCVLMYLSALLAFCRLSPRSVRAVETRPGEGGKPFWGRVTTVLRLLGMAGLVYLALAFRNGQGQAILSLSPFSIRTQWYGILGLIGWAYLVGATAFLIFRENHTALLGCMVLLFCLYPADQTGAFQAFWLAHYVGIGTMLGSHAAITVGGVLLAVHLRRTEGEPLRSRVRFVLLFIAGCIAGALLLNGLYGINKNHATPSWCLWACAFTGLLWLLLDFFSDVRPISFAARPLAIAGQNVLLAYLISELLPSLIGLVRLDNWYDALAPNLGCAIARSAGCALVILCASVALNRVGFRLKL